jgi:hypothetical protein
MLRIFVIAGAQQLTTKAVVGTSGRPVELLLAGSDCQDAVAAGLAGDLLLTDGNIENLKKAHDFAMVRPENLSTSDYIELLIWIPPFYAESDRPLPEASRGIEDPCLRPQGTCCPEKAPYDERTENSHLEMVNAKLQQQLEEQKRELEANKYAHQEQLKEQKKAHQGKPLLPSGTCTV